MYFHYGPTTDYKRYMYLPKVSGDKSPLYYRKWKLTIWHNKKEIPNYLEEMEE